jgi:hypothetical protein
MLREPAANAELDRDRERNSVPDSSDSYKGKYLELMGKYVALQEKHLALKEQRDEHNARCEVVVDENERLI